jgi:hypothetical protein
MLSSQFFGEKIGVFLKKQCYDHIFAKTGSSLSTKTASIFAKCFGENLFEIIISVPGPVSFCDSRQNKIEKKSHPKWLLPKKVKLGT